MEAGVLNNPHPTTDIQNLPGQHGNLGLTKARQYRSYGPDISSVSG
jgi:hypothetical protein